MKKNIVVAVALTSLLLLLQPIAAQPNNCYTSYKLKGDTYKDLKNYDLAIQQYQSAKYCSSLTAEQRKILDSLIAYVNKLKPQTKIIRRI